ncbi:M56 family metallopeptidase [Sphingomonas sp. 10B4]|uniref:M56 family metallopeptidase n=1 Tax=Sphingomonas sp. 10B4 TaxID=3048575 RepID=UPI002AB37400|nr:M56 family metallopeptidase [Sphingomonas sp. 10B4]MDY7525597.1 M56 family metallopeptidase [Sphingomonas sp. 10B4]MEB0282610.1 M56 family metallopeptidase [Sphingomonas sp. 10B4]
MTDWISPSWLIEALIGSSVLMVAVLLLRRPVRKAFGADVAYALWLLPVLRLALPPLPSAWHDAAVAPVLHATEQMSVLFAEPVAAATAASAPAQEWLVPVLASLWIAGAGAFVAWHALAHHRFCRRMLDQAASSEEHGGVYVIETGAASGPLAFGVWRRYVAFPHDFAERFEAEERDLALAHELGHHARGDLIANWVALVVLGLHWFNPIAWRAFRAFRADQEIANDARVLAGMNPMRRHTYACAILKAAHPSFLGGTVSATCHLHTIDDLKGRLKMLTTTRTSRTRLLAGAGMLTLLAAGGLGLTASGTAAAAKVRSTVEAATGVDLASLDQAVAAPPPAAAVPAAPSVPAAPRPAPRMREHVEASDMPGPGLPPAPEPPLPPSDVADAVPPAPPAPPMPATGKSGPGMTTTMVTVTKDGKRVVRYGRYVKLNRDGSATLVGEIGAMPPIPAMLARPAIGSMPPIPPMPQVSSRNCGPRGKDGTMVIKERSAIRQRIIICTDWIAAAAAKGAAMAANSKDMERNAYSHALDGLNRSRAHVMASAAMTAAQRKEALAGIDTAIAELEADLAHAR